MKKKNIKVGDQYGSLTIISENPHYIQPSGRTRRSIHCLCSCGRETDVLLDNLYPQHTTSCGCVHKQKLIDSLITHGMSYSPTYITYKSMVQRCYDPKATSYGRYGANGIKVCKRWLVSFENFLIDMGERPGGMTLDRINNSKVYSKKSCRWATLKAQAQNRKSVKFITYNGQTLCMADWGNFIGGGENTVAQRIRAGWGPIKAVSTRVKNKQHG